MLLLLNKASVVHRIIERNMKCLPLKQFITMLPNTEVIIISSFDLLLLQVKTLIIITKQYLYC